MLANIETYKRTVARPKGTVLYLHSFMGNFQMKNSLFNHLSDYDVYALNMPGHGKSPLEGEDKINMPRFVELAKEFAEGEDLNGIILIGHSLGGGIGAALNSLIPGRVRLNVFEAPACGVMLQNADTVRRLVPKSLADSEFVMERMYSDPRQIFGNRLKAVIAQEYERCKETFAPFDKMFGQSEMVFNTRMFDSGFANIKRPTLVILGEADGILPTPLMREHLRAIGNPFIRVAEVPGAGHAVYSERKAAFLGLLEEFLDENGK